jgi:hypothetical protein
VYNGGGNVTINGGNVPNGKKVTIYIIGNARITSDIAYAGSNGVWPNVNQIPQIKIVVQGVLHIDAGVNRLDGVYAAVPDNNNFMNVNNSYANPRPGTISTCSNVFTVRNPGSIAPFLNACDETLEVNGSLSGNHIFLLRAIGTMSNGPAAESFKFSPEVWLVPNDNSTIDPSYQSIVGLPPVL